MLVQFVSDHYSDELGNSGEKQVGMKRFLILRFTPGNTKTVFEMVDRFLNIYSDFIGGIPFICTADCTRIDTKILLRINVDHSSTGRSGTWMITVAYAFRFLCGAVPFPFHFGAYEFHSRKPAAQMGFASLALHGKGGIMGTAGNAVIIDSVIDSFEFQFVFQRNICFFKGSFLKQIFRALRYALMNTAHNVVKNNTTFKAYYDAKRAEGRTHYNAIGHCVGKLVRVILKMLTDEVEFNLE